MDIHQLHIFASVYRQKSFTKAARKINMSQPTVSEHIKNLESELECKLFDRVGKTIEPTIEARKLFPKAVTILEDIFQLKSDMLGGDKAVKGEITFGASTIPSTYILPQRIRQFRNSYPDIFFQVKIKDSQNINRLIIDNELFCGIVGAKTNEKALVYEPFYKDELCIVASPHLINEDLDTLDWRKLPFVQRESGSGTRKAMEKNFRRMGVSLKKNQIVAEFGSTSSIKEAAKAGLGATVISQLAVQEELKNKSLCVIPLKDEIMERFFYLVHHKKRTLPNSYLTFCKFLTEKRNEKLDA